MNNMPPTPENPVAQPAMLSKKTSGMAIASLVLGIISIFGAAILIIPTILAIVFGHISISRINRDKTLGGMGLAITGLVLGYVSIIFGVIFAGLLAAMAIPAFQKVREESMRKVMANDARQIAAAAQQVMVENAVTKVVFEVDPATGKVSGPIANYAPKITPGTRAVDGVFETQDDTFSLQNPKAYGGAVITFDSEGKKK